MPSNSKVRLFRNDKCRPDIHASVYRYMTLDHFEWLVLNRKLYFSSSKFLSETLDSHECSYPTNNTARIALEAGRINEEEIHEIIQKRKDRKSKSFINCWSQGECESYLMWNCYGKSGKGIAIKSSVTSLLSSLQPDGDYRCRIGKVHYADFDNFDKIKGLVPNPNMLKREEFRDEKEIRILLEFERVQTEKAVIVPVDLETLISEIIVSPFENMSTHDAVANLLARHPLGPSNSAILKMSSLTRMPEL